MPRAGFFNKVELQMVKAPPARLPACGACGLFRSCVSPKMQVAGKGKKKILVVADYPSHDADLRGSPLSDEAGRYLAHKMGTLGVDLKQDCWVTSAIICHPEDKKAIKEDVVNHCRPNLNRVLEELKPEKVLLLNGNDKRAPDRKAMAIRSFVGGVWREKPGDLVQWAGFLIPDQKRNAWTMPTYHPRQLLKDDNPIQSRRFLRHLKRLLKTEGRPWSEPPDWVNEVDIELRDKVAVAKIEKFNDAGRPVAFDFETNMLKPDSKLAEIVCCAISDGKTTVSYPWTRRTAAATFALLRNRNVVKYGYNLKFEERWVLKFFGKGVRNWRWDGMIGAHVIDSRSSICGLKFQSYVLLGQPAYDDHIKPYLEAPTGNTPNKIRQLPIEELLKYCGMDALLEYKVARDRKSTRLNSSH